MKSKSLVVACIVFSVFFMLTGVAVSQTTPTELCVVIDGSGSISSSDFDLQLQGVANAVQDPTVVPQDGNITISVIQFASSARVEVQPTVIDSAATANNVANAILAISKLGGGTSYVAAINEAVASGFTFATNRQIIDMSTDGQPNDSNTSPLRQQAVGAGVDVINAIAVGGISTQPLQDLVYPQPASQPFDPGFIVEVNNFQEYVNAIQNKIKQEITPGPAGDAAQVPTISEWGMILLSLFLAGTALWAIRKKTMA